MFGGSLRRRAGGGEDVEWVGGGIVWGWWVGEDAGTGGGGEDFDFVWGGVWSGVLWDRGTVDRGYHRLLS